MLDGARDQLVRRMRQFEELVKARLEVDMPGMVAGAIAHARVFIVDLRRPDALAALEAAAAVGSKIGFVDHERVDIMDAARERGCVALAKGKFSSDLPKLLANLPAAVPT